LARFFLSYATANDDPAYVVDFTHFANLRAHHPGVPLVTMLIAVSAVEPVGRRDKRARRRMFAAFRNCREIQVENVVFKSNVGRDFSSHSQNLSLIASQASDEDFVLFVNRSAYGPTMDNWYSAFVKQYSRFPNIGLCGSTINFLGHPQRPSPPPNTHVQTYVFLAKMEVLRSYVGRFPGENEVERLHVITEGEIGLSGRILAEGWGLTCLAWPDDVFTAESPTRATLPMRDIKKDVQNLPFIYRSESYEISANNAGVTWLRRIARFWRAALK
jgi:hypothetical protein